MSFRKANPEGVWIEEEGRCLKCKALVLTNQDRRSHHMQSGLGWYHVNGCCDKYFKDVGFPADLQLPRKRQGDRYKGGGEKTDRTDIDGDLGYEEPLLTDSERRALRENPVGMPLSKTISHAMYRPKVPRIKQTKKPETKTSAEKAAEVAARQAKRARLTPADLPHIGEVTRLWWLGHHA